MSSSEEDDGPCKRCRRDFTDEEKVAFYFATRIFPSNAESFRRIKEDERFRAAFRARSAEDLQQKHKNMLKHGGAGAKRERDYVNDLLKRHPRVEERWREYLNGTRAPPVAQAVPVAGRVVVARERRDRPRFEARRARAASAASSDGSGDARPSGSSSAREASALVIDLASDDSDEASDDDEPMQAAAQHRERSAAFKRDARALFPDALRSGASVTYARRTLVEVEVHALLMARDGLSRAQHERPIYSPLEGRVLRADFVSDTEVIEVKDFEHRLRAIGQLMHYHRLLHEARTARRARIHLFNVGNRSALYGDFVELVQRGTNRGNIKVVVTREPAGSPYF